MELYNFNTAYTNVKEFYGIELSPDQFETMGLAAWSKIGNKMYELVTTSLQIEDYYLKLPCEADEIEAVYYGTPDYQSTSNYQDTPLIYNQFTEQYIDLRRDENRNVLNVPGKLIKYRVVDPNTLQLDIKDGWVNIMYKTIKFDSQGLPLLNIKEVDAIAAYCAYAISFKKGIMTRDQASIEISNILKQEWLKLCDHARTPMHISQNDFDAIGDVKYSWDRKTYGKSYKPVR